ncbi:MAG: maltooligosyltrehalose trehalohydrolase [Solirubrobacteraceae bacterium]|nr:maltooligosyltrehalose trehalohydrolase [Solirubrobacteraceae bacterium]
MPSDRLPWERRLGATPIAGGRVEFRCWAPNATEVAVRVNGSDHPMTDAGHGVREATVEAAGGDDYEFVLDGTPLPDPATRWQPESLRAPSRVVDPREFEWTDGGYDPPALEDLVLYELHVGTFSDDGTFAGVIGHLGELADLGVNAIELMPVAEFPGERGWGYDGVYISAAESSYGGPFELARLVDAAHAHGIAVILDAVYNHVGASGNTALQAYGPYHTDKYGTFWGAAMNFDDEDSGAVREWVLQSAEGWVRDYHVDGLRLDAIHAIYDSSAEHLVAAISRRVHAANHNAIVIAESGLNDPKVVRPASQGGWGCDAAWADDFHHALRVLLTGDTDGYYAEFGRVRDLVKAFHRPHVHDGTYSSFRRRRFGAPAEGCSPEQFVVFSANHDQVGNRALGDRLPREVRPLAALCTLLSPFTPMIFMGDEYGERAPFQFFTDHIDEEIAVATREGRRREFGAFAAFAGEQVPDPQDPATFERSKLTREVDEELLALHRQLLDARRGLPEGDAVPAGDETGRWLRVRRGDQVMVANFGAEAVTVPLEAPPTEVVVGTHVADTQLEARGVRLPPLAGALVR